MTTFNNRSRGSIHSIGQRYARTYMHTPDLFFNFENRYTTLRIKELPLMNDIETYDFITQQGKDSLHASKIYRFLGIDSYTVLDRSKSVEIAYEYGYRPLQNFHVIPEFGKPYFERELTFLLKGNLAILEEDSFNRKMAKRTYFAYLTNDNFRVHNGRSILWQQELRLSHAGLEQSYADECFEFLVKHHEYLDVEYEKIASSFQLNRFQLGVLEQLIYEIGILRLTGDESNVAFNQAVLTSHKSLFFNSPEEIKTFFYTLRRYIMSGFITGYDKLNKKLKWKRPVWATPEDGHIVAMDEKILDVLKSFV